MLAALLVVTRVVSAGVFLVAAVTKLADRAGTRDAITAFGAPRRSAAALAVVLPLAELAVAALLVPAPTSVYGALGALLLLALFSAAIGWNLLHGRAPDCHCFGQLHSAPAGWQTLARNAGLAGLAVFAIGGSLTAPDASATAWLGRLDGAELVALAVGVSAAVVVAAGVAAFVSLLRSYGGVLVRLERVEAALADAGIELGDDVEVPEIGLEPGTAAPPFWAHSLTGETVSLETLAASGLPSLLLFTSPHCGPCKNLLPVASEWQHDYAEELAVVFVSDGAPDEVRAEAAELGLRHVLLDERRDLYRAYEANGTPSAVLLAPDGTIGSWVASGRDWIEQLVAQAVEQPDEEQGLPVGAEAPALELRSLEGELVGLESLRGRDALLLFWNPDCGFCRAMHDGVIAWEAAANEATPRLVIVSSGDEESSRREGFQSLVLLDEGFSAGSAFGANGTPMGVLVDVEGRVASRVVAGADAVFALAAPLELASPTAAR
jgi:thiol-disulfide isomerase/thioredoxin